MQQIKARERKKKRVRNIFFFIFLDLIIVTHMRIRRRFLSPSAVITAPSSLDFHGGDHHQPLLLVQQQELHPNGNIRVLYDNKSQPSDPPQTPSSDHNTQIGLQPSTWVSSVAGSHDPAEPMVFPQKESGKKKELIKNNDSGRKESTLSAEASSDHVVIKGKRVNRNLVEDDEMIAEEPKKNEMSAACPRKHKKNGKKRGNVIMEGSRCSRVNGRGWRCCQQTLVGYSLCQHHLGKGRLRGQAQKVVPKDFESEDDEQLKDWEEESMSIVEGKKKKIGVVKARSLSSLLSQISR